jgi:hypothetical protein
MLVSISTSLRFRLVKFFFSHIYDLQNHLLILLVTDLQIIGIMKKNIMDGGSKHLPFTVPPLIISALRVCFLLIVADNCFTLYVCTDSYMRYT